MRVLALDDDSIAVGVTNIRDVALVLRAVLRCSVDEFLPKLIAEVVGHRALERCACLFGAGPCATHS